jgi:hypothetical protein
MKTLCRSNEIMKDLSIFLSEDCIHYILHLEREALYKESVKYWNRIFLKGKNKLRYFYSNNDIIIDLHSQIIRMNGSLQNVRNENKEIKILEEDNRLWAEAWMRGTRF